MPITAEGRYEVTLGGLKGYAKKSARSRDEVLSTQQVFCLMGRAQGLGIQDLAKLKGVSADSVKRTLRAAYDKLKVNDAAHAVFEAMKRGIIAPLMILLALAGPLMTEDDLRRPNPPRIPRPAARASARARGRRREDWLDWEGLS